MTTGVTVDFNANLARFTSGVDKAIADLNKFQTNAERISGNISKAFGALGVGLGVGAFTAFIKSTVDAQDHLNDLSKTTRLSVEQLAGLSLAAKKSGSDLDGTAKAINKLAVEMGKDSEKFAALGVNAKSPLEAFAQLADVMNAIDDPQKRAAVGAVALGKSWEASAPLMAEGGKAIRDMIEEGKKLSKVNAESAKAADEFNDKWEELKATAGGWGVAIANPIVDGLLKIHNALSMEINKKPGSIAEFIFGPTRSRGWTGAKDANGLPLLTSPDAPAATPGAPSKSAVDRFIGGAGAGKIGKTDLQRMIELGQKNLYAGLDSEEDMRLLAQKRAMEDTRAEFEALQRMLKVGQDNELAAYYETAGEETMRLVAEQRELQDAIKKNDDFAKELGMTFSSAFEDAIIGGKDLSSILQGLAQDVQRIFVRKTVTEPLANSLGGLFGKFDFGNLFGSGGGGSGSFDWMPSSAPSFAGGGNTGNGPRSGGLDGEGGFWAIMHPQETVTDHTRGGDAGGAVTVQINFAVGIAQTVRAEVLSMMPQIQAATTAGIVDARRRGGAVRAAFAR